MQHPSLTFTLPLPIPRFGPRVGRVTLTRDGDAGDGTDANDDATVHITLDTPNVLVSTSRGVVPHLSRDHTNESDAIRWINVPFESFLEQVPPIPTLQNGPHPLHRFLGFDKDRHIASLCLRNPLDTRQTPPNGNTYVCANCVRGVKKVTPSDWRTYVYKMRPDVVFALTDTPFTPPPFSQKRMTKSIERSTTWVADILRPLPGADASSDSHTPRHPLNVFVHMAGGTSLPAREAFAYGLRETLHGPEADAVKPLRYLDEGISGYAFDLAVLRGFPPRPDMLQHPEPIAEELTQRPTVSNDASDPESRIASPNLVSLLKTSLGELSERKPRLVTGARSPHEMLRLIRDVGVDLFDVGWVMNAADLGIALDFVFPIPATNDTRSRQRLGLNLYDPMYAHQFGRLADALVGAGESADGQRRVCTCIACSPRSPSSHTLHSAVDHQSYATEVQGYQKPYSRAYIHHLLRAHEMSAHAFLVAHNLSVVSEFLAGVRRAWVESGSAQFMVEVEKFSDAYDEGEELYLAAKKDWEYVDKARGKWRLGRERGKPEDEMGDEERI